MAMHLHLDCFSGISGDMLLGALVDGGLPPTKLRQVIKSLALQGCRLEMTKVLRGTIQATKVTVSIRRGFDAPLSLSKIRRRVTSSRLPDAVKSRSLAVFDSLAQAEGKVHGVEPSKVHFHEVGIIDSLVDVVGGILGCHVLNVATVSASPVNLGAGLMTTHHGTLPVPGPAVAELSKGIPVFSAGPQRELTTPTGLSLLRHLAQEFRTLPPLQYHTIGYGAGSYNSPDWPNVLRIFLGTQTTMESEKAERLHQIETNIDDMNPQIYETVMDRLFGVGALDVTITPVIMKRSRPGVVVSVLVPPDQSAAVTHALFEETSTLGVRVKEVSRYLLPRILKSVRLPKGTVRVKISKTGNKGVKFTPEYQDCKAIALKTGRPVREILQEAIQAIQPERLKSRSGKLAHRT